jgi:hypothetical protein
MAFDYFGNLVDFPASGGKIDGLGTQEYSDIHWLAQNTCDPISFERRQSADKIWTRHRIGPP